MKVKLIFEDWRQVGEALSIYNTELGLYLSAGDLHSGTVFYAELHMPPEIEDEIREAMAAHKAYPVFQMMPK